MSEPSTASRAGVSLERYLAERKRLVESYLDAYLPGEDVEPATLSRAVRYSVFAGGKRLRPILAMGASEALGGTAQDALPAAAAVEMIHTYSLIHDDLPSMDDDSLRRGRPTSHVVFGEAVAILAGDALQAHAFQVLADPPAPCRVSQATRLRVVGLLTEAAGAAGMVGGQVADLESEGKRVDARTLDFIHRRKTGALIRAACTGGALMAGGSDEAAWRLARYGEHVGLAFQIVDDILDVEGEAAALGKTVGKDQRAGKATYPRVHGIDQARKRAKELVGEAAREITFFGEPAEPLLWLAQSILDRRS